MLFDPIKIRDVTFKNRIAVSPMCRDSSENGFSGRSGAGLKGGDHERKN